MQAPQRIKIRFGILKSQPVQLEKAIPVFHRWIQEGKTAATMIDVADYKHVPAGPGVMLVGHSDDLGLDNGRRIGEEGLGFYYVRKHGRLEDVQPLSKRLQEIWALTLATGLLLEAEEDLNVSLETSQAEISLVDRLFYPPTAVNLPEVEFEIRSSLSQVLGDVDFSMERTDTDVREAVSWMLKLSKGQDFASLASRLSG